jgi:uncharacterized protein YidB (DUF937 family)
MDLMSIAQDLIKDKLGDNVNTDSIQGAIQGLFSNGNGDFDISSIIANLSQNGGLGDMVSSWLGDGENMPIDTDTIANMFGNDKIADFASKLGVDSSSATSLLSDVVPNLVDKSSSGGNILDSVGGLDGALDLAKKFF